MSEAVEFTSADVEQRTAGLPDDQRNSVTCALVGHSRIQTTFFGYYYCARCGAQVGDALAGVYSQAGAVVIVGHDCDVCRANAKTLTWKDTIFAPDPFGAQAVAK